MHWLQIFRIVVLSWGILSAFVLLGVGAHTLSALSTLKNLPTFAWAGLAVATAVFAILTLPAMLVIDFFRTGAFSSLIVVELAWFGFLGVLLLATGGTAADTAANFWANCQSWSPALARNICSETSAAAAFGFLGWLFLWAYAITLLVLLIIHANRGHYVWNTTVKEANFGAGLPPSTTPAPGAAAAAYGTEAKPYEAASLNPGQVPYAYPPNVTASPPPTNYAQPAQTGYAQQPYGQPAGAPAHPGGYPQV